MLKVIKNKKTGKIHYHLTKNEALCGLIATARESCQGMFIQKDIPNRLYDLEEIDIAYDEFINNENMCKKCKNVFFAQGNSSDFNKNLLSRFKKD